MAPRHTPAKPVKNPPHHDPTHAGMDRERHKEEKRHHPADDHVHPPLVHHAQKNPPGLPLHHPHSQPADRALDIDHGTHTDRPRPGKIAKKEEPGHRKT